MLLDVVEQDRMSGELDALALFLAVELHGLLSCSDPALAQRICDELSPEKLDSLFRNSYQSVAKARDSLRRGA